MRGPRGASATSTRAMRTDSGGGSAPKPLAGRRLCGWLLGWSLGCAGDLRQWWLALLLPQARIPPFGTIALATLDDHLVTPIRFETVETTKCSPRRLTPTIGRSGLFRPLLGRSRAHQDREVEARSPRSYSLFDSGWRAPSDLLARFKAKPAAVAYDSRGPLHSRCGRSPMKLAAGSQASR